MSFLVLFFLISPPTPLNFPSNNTSFKKKFDPLPANNETTLINTPYILFAFLGFDGGFFYCFKSRFSRNYKNFMRISRYPEMVRKLWWNYRGNDSSWIWKFVEKLFEMISKNSNMLTLSNFPRFFTPPSLPLYNAKPYKSFF